MAPPPAAAAGDTQHCLRLSTEQFPPHIMFSREREPLAVAGSLVRILDIIADTLDFCYEFVLPDRLSRFGRRLANGTWTGVMGAVARAEANMSGTVLSMDAERAEAVDFSEPLYMDKQVIVSKKPVLESDLAGFMKPFTPSLWPLLLVVMLVVCFGTFLLQWCDDSILPHHPRTEFFSSLWFRSRSSDEVKSEKPPSQQQQQQQPERGRLLVFAWTSALWTSTAILAQSSPWWPRGGVVRLVTGLWLLMAFILGSVYRSNLKAMLILPKVQLPFNSIEELVETDIPCFVPGGSLIHAHMMANEGSVLYRLRQQAVLHVDLPRATSDIIQGKYAGVVTEHNVFYAMDQFFSQTNTCPLYVAKEPLFGINGVALIFPKGSPLKRKVDHIIRSLRDFGILEHLLMGGVLNATKCLNTGSPVGGSNSLRPLDLGDFYGVFSVYAGGVLVAAMVFFMEMVLKGHPRP